MLFCQYFDIVGLTTKGHLACETKETFIDPS